MNASSSFVVELNGDAAGTGYDQLVVDVGPVDLGNATLDASRLSSFVPAAGTSFTIIDNTTALAVSGTFDGLAEGEVFLIDGILFQITYSKGNVGANYPMSRAFLYESGPAS